MYSVSPVTNRKRARADTYANTIRDSYTNTAPYVAANNNKQLREPAGTSDTIVNQLQSH